MDRLPAWLDATMLPVAELFDELRKEARERAEAKAEKEAQRGR
ncbi:hypothetical protein [Streptomyces sp. NPDC005385]